MPMCVLREAHPWSVLRKHCLFTPQSVTVAFPPASQCPLGVIIPQRLKHQECPHPSVRNPRSTHSQPVFLQKGLHNSLHDPRMISFLCDHRSGHHPVHVSLGRYTFGCVISEVSMLWVL